MLFHSQNRVKAGLGSEDFHLLWPQSSAPHPLSPGQVHVWSVCLDQPAAFSKTLFDTLSTDEKQRATRFRFEQERQRFMNGRGLLREILAGYTGTTPSSIAFVYGPNGKPSLVSSPKAQSQVSIEFNLSHTGKLMIVAITLDNPVGADVERICWISEMCTIAKNYFFPQELKRWKQTDEALKLRVFFELWTTKEAILKREGLGLANINILKEIPALHTISIQPTPSCIGCLALRQKTVEEHYWQWPTGQ